MKADRLLRVLLDTTVRGAGNEPVERLEPERTVDERVVDAIARGERLDELMPREVERLEDVRDCTERVEPLRLDDDRGTVE